jgi:uncharacterized membrane protein YqhA
MPDKDIKKKFASSKIVISSANFVGAILFYIAYSKSNIIWFLIAAIALVASSILAYAIISKFEQKIVDISKAEDKQ